MVLSLERWSGKVAIVTGASSGIGAAIAEKLVENGVIVAGFARRLERVKENAKKLAGKKGKLHGVKVDVTKEQEILEGFKWVKNNLGPIHILVNNAGLSPYSSLTSDDTALWRRVFDTNVLALCICTREAVKDMQANNIDGHIIHMNSIAGHGAFPGINVYPASKNAVTALTETLRQELNSEKLKIKITSISPGRVETEIMAGFPKQMLDMLSKANLPLQPEDIANAALYVLSTPPHVQVHELIIKPVGEMF